MASVSTVDVSRPQPARRVRRLVSGAGLHGSDFAWALAFVLPYVAVFVAFVIYPVAYGLWLGSDPRSYTALFNDPIYPETVVNTLIYVVIGVNLKLFLALLLSGFFMRPQWWVRALMLVFILPWAVPAIPTFISIHWMLNGQWGLVNNLIWDLFQTDGPPWLDTPNLAMASVIVAYIWKWLPFWTVIFLAGRMAIPKDCMRRPTWTARQGSTGSCTSPSRSCPTSIWSARCSRPFGRSGTSTRSIS